MYLTAHDTTVYAYRNMHDVRRRFRLLFRGVIIVYRLYVEY